MVTRVSIKIRCSRYHRKMYVNLNHFVLILATDLVMQRVTALQAQAPNLTCYTCNTVTEPDCQTLPVNASNVFEKMCKPNEIFCMVTRVQYTLESEDMQRKFWSIERNCASECDSGCTIVGERTKLRFCRQCCRGRLCNNGNGAASNSLKPGLWIIIWPALFYLCRGLAASNSG